MKTKWPGSVLGTVHELSRLIFLGSNILLIRKLMLRIIKQAVQGHSGISCGAEI